MSRLIFKDLIRKAEWGAEGISSPSRYCGTRKASEWGQRGLVPRVDTVELIATHHLPVVIMFL